MNYHIPPQEQLELGGKLFWTIAIITYYNVEKGFKPGK